MKIKPALLTLSLLLMLAAGCGRPPSFLPTTPAAAQPPAAASATAPAAQPPSAEAPQDKAEILKGIQRSLDLLAQAYNERNGELLQQAVDQDNPPFRRLLKTQFDDYMKSYYAGQVTFRYRVLDIEQQANGTALAQIEAFGWLRGDWLFRWNGSAWVLTEPTVEELGEKQTREDEQFIFEFYPYMGETNERVIELVERAAARVKAKLGRLPEEKAVVRIKPNYGIDPYADPNALAYFQRGNDKKPDRIELFAPFSYTFGLYDPQEGWEKDLEDTITHEYTHMTHLRAFGSAGKMMDWFGEGLAEYTADSQRVREVGDALRQGTLIPILDTSGQVYKQDLMHLYILEKDVSLAYAEAQALILYIIDRYGSLDKAWELARAHDEIQDFDQALRRTFGIGYQEFDKAWRAWMAARY